MVTIRGFQKLTLLDYPGKVGCTVFLGGCNFRCPFCQNAGLVLAPEKEPVIEEEQVLQVLKKRQGILEGVCITGGEPTLSAELPEFLKRIKELGYAVKLDTNGSHPEILQQLAEARLIDFVAMDIKNSPARYAETTGASGMTLSEIQESVDFLKNGELDYEFRTTVCQELHGKKELLEIGQWLSGSSRYFLQFYRESESVIRPVFSPYSSQEMKEFQKMLLAYLPRTEVRGGE